MDEAVSRAARRTIVDTYLTEISLLAKELCPAAQIEATTERYEDVVARLSRAGPHQRPQCARLSSGSEDLRPCHAHAAGLCDTRRPRLY
jgi:hypothetical protein